MEAKQDGISAEKRIQLIQQATRALQQGGIAEVSRVAALLLQANPNDDEASNLLAIAHLHNNQVPQALNAVQKAISLSPKKAHFQLTLALIMKKSGRLDEALQCYDTMLKLGYPNQGQVFSDAGRVLETLGRTDEAIKAYESALSIKTNNAGVMVRLGNLYVRIGALDKAGQWYDKALEKTPGYGRALAGKSMLYAYAKDYEKAAAFAQQAVDAEPDFKEAWIYLYSNHYKFGRHAKAMQIVDQAYARFNDPYFLMDKAFMFPAIPRSEQEIEVSRQFFMETIGALKASPDFRLPHPEIQPFHFPFYHSYQGKNNKDIMVLLADFFQSASPELVYEAPHCGCPRPAKKKPRVGFVSSYFHASVFSLCYNDMLSVCAKRGDIDIYALSLSHIRDAVTDKLAQEVQHFTVLPSQLGAVREQLAALELDALVYLDIGVSTQAYFLAFSRLAPIQCTTTGHPITTGIPTMDYYLTARNMEPENYHEHYSEEPILMENTPSLFVQPEKVEITKSRAELGLPDNGETLYSCPMYPFRIHPDMDRIFQRILHEDSRAHIILFEHSHKTLWIELLRERFARLMTEDELARIHFLPHLPREDYISVLRCVHAILDPLHFGMGTTIYNLSAENIPVVTLPGQFMRDRITGRVYDMMGMKDTVAKDAEDYVNIAVRMANDPKWREEVSDKIAAQKHNIFNKTVVIDELAELLLERIGNLPREE